MRTPEVSMKWDEGEERETAEVLLVRVFVGDSETERRAFCLKEKISLGRDPYTDVLLEDPAVSRLHFVIQREDSNLVLYDRSSNGTLVNGKRTKRHLLRSRDVISVGQFTVVCEIHPDSKLSLYDQARAEGMPLDDQATIPWVRGTPRRSPAESPRSVM
jgi:pSer/pThr/pTyr-binding forkhead associated (FHA) protein